MPDKGFQTESFIFSSAGLVARYAPDRVPNPRFHPDAVLPRPYLNLMNAESRRENALSSRQGRLLLTADYDAWVGKPLSLDGATNIHTIGRLKGINGGVTRYAINGTRLWFRNGDSAGAFTGTSPGFNYSGQKASLITYRPDFNSSPILFIADKARLQKIGGPIGGAGAQWGINPPTVLPTATVAAPSIRVIDDYEVGGQAFVVSHVNKPSNHGIAGVDDIIANPATNLTLPITATGVQDATPGSMTDIVPGALIGINQGGATQEYVTVISVTPATFRANFAFTHATSEGIWSTAIQGWFNNPGGGLTASIALPKVVDLSSFANGTAASDRDVIHLGLTIDTPAKVTSLTIELDVGNGSFTDVYRYVVQQVPSIANQYQVLAITRGKFSLIGAAGSNTHTWANVAAYRFTAKLTGAADSANITFDAFYMGIGPALDSTGGQPYDYRYTYYERSTGCESNPSQTMIDDNRLTAVNQAVQLSWTPSPDTQVDAVRLYRRGGSLNSGWLMVAQITIGATTFTDDLSDIDIASNLPLEVDNDPPVTSKLPSPVITSLSAAVTAPGLAAVNVASVTNLYAGQLVTIGAGFREEDVYVQSVGGGSITAYFQFTHGSGESVSASTRPNTPMNLAAVAFDKAWLAGDPNNPNILYYSKTTRPESFSPAGYIEVGNPSDPIMGLVEMRGVLHVFTIGTIYQVGVINGVVQNPVKTGVRHGLAGSFAWCLDENAIWYLGLDGVYEYTGGSSQLRSKGIGWLFDSQSFGPVPPLGTFTDACMTFHRNEIFFAYTDTLSTRRRLIYSLEFERWRPDSAPVNTMYTEEDTQTLVISLQNGNMIFTDHISGQNFDGDSLQIVGPNHITVPTPMALDIRTALTDQGLPKVDKVYNEVTLDADTGQETVTFSLVFDDGNTEVVLSNAVTCAGGGRQRFNFNVNAGVGQTSKNIGFRISGNVGTNASSANSEVIVYQIHVRFHVEAEKRKSADTYWMRFGTDAYKIVKQGWFEYSAPDAGGVAVSIYADGNITTPVYTFTLPQSTTRTAALVRFVPIKAKLLRFIATSASDFKLYDETGAEIKPFNQAKGYSRMRLAA